MKKKKTKLRTRSNVAAKDFVGCEHAQQMHRSHRPQKLSLPKKNKIQFHVKMPFPCVRASERAREKASESVSDFAIQM